MPKGSKADKPKMDYIKTETLHDNILNCVKDIVLDMGYDLNDPKQRKNITHNELNYILRQVYYRLFKPQNNLYNNQNSLIDYDNLTQLEILSNTFLDICAIFNKSLGLMSFSYLLGCSYSTLINWLKDENNNELNSKRLLIIKSIQESHKAAQIGLLNDSPVGALAVANNDPETGLEWSKQQAQQLAQNQVFILPSERMSKLKLEKVEQ